MNLRYNRQSQLDKKALVEWLRIRLACYRNREHKDERLHLDVRAAEVSSILETVEKELYQDAKRPERRNR